MFATTVDSDGDARLPATQPASPSAAEPTRTSEPLAPTRSDGAAPGAPASLGTSQLRDPDRYQIIGEHGRGGLGRVSRAHDRELGRDVAIKELISRGHVSEVRFLREALITARLEHPGIVPVHEAGRWPDGTPFYAMKLVAGRSLRELIADRATVDERIGLLHHVIAVADAIAYAHGRSIIHRDLKPANVIVGDFGETIVIDWGLAKDLTATEDSTIGGGPFRASRGDGLTSTGSVLGTPAYMAPEQERGEYVDQRADVFAIGAMLWELCALHKVPPTERHVRHRMLRRAGIDKDLATIIDKALDPEPAGRYPDAGALAADLKAFKAGACISARSYSVPAILGRWFRRHRTLAISITAAIAFAVSGSVLYVRNIAIERDRAETSSNRLVLEHAELLLHSDPTAAFELLQDYRGAETDRLAMLRAKARGLGLSHLRVRPHTQGIVFAHALADGSLVTLGYDGAVVKTTPGGASRVIASGATAQSRFDYADARHVLVYTCDSTIICLLDIQSETAQPPPADVAALAPAALALSPSGDLLAAISAHGDTSVWQLGATGSPALRYQTRFESGESIRFIDEQTIAAQTSEHIHLVHLRTPARPLDTRSELSMPDTSDLGASGELHLIAVGTAAGGLTIIDAQRDQIVRRETICKGRVNRVLALSSRSAIAYACQDGDAGIWDLRQNTTTTVGHIEGGAVIIAASADGRYLLVGGSNGTVLAYDFTTRMLSSFLGHAARLTALLPPSPEFPYIVSGDSSGTLRTWSPPDAAVRVAIKTAAHMSKAILLANNGPLIAIGDGATIPWYMRDGASGELQGHNPSHFIAAISGSGSRQPRFALFGLDDDVELWSFEPQPVKHTLRTSHGGATTAVFGPDGAHLVVGSHDGTITEWSSDGDTHRDLGSIHEPIDVLRTVPNTDTVVIAGASGTLWLTDKAGISQLGKETGSIAAAICSPDSRWLAVGTSRGLVRLYDLSTREAKTIFNTPSWIAFLTFPPDSTDLMIATDSKVIAFPITRSSAEPATRASLHRATRWHELPLAVQYIAFSPDHKWLAMTCDHGDIWFYRREDGHWIYLSTGTAKVPFGRFSDDSAYFGVNDSSGRALLVDMHAGIFD